MLVNTPVVHPRPPVCMYSTFFVLGLEKNTTNDLLLGSVFYTITFLNTFLLNMYL